MKRVATSVVLALFALYSIFVASDPVFAAIVGTMASLCYYEYAGIVKATGIEGPLWAGYAAGLVAMARPDAIPLLAPAVLALALRSRNLSKALLSAGVLVLGVLYIFVGWRWAMPLREAGPPWLLFALSINWIGDVAAYYVGRAVGRHKLAPRVSPGKSWEGAIASIVAAIVYGVAFRYLLLPQIPILQMIVLSLLANVAGQVGDLAESAIKRGAGLKDSGTLLPGHGGFLDRLDSTLFTLPVVYFSLRWLI